MPVVTCRKCGQTGHKKADRRLSRPPRVRAMLLWLQRLKVTKMMMKRLSRKRKKRKGELTRELRIDVEDVTEHILSPGKSHNNRAVGGKREAGVEFLEKELSS